MVLLPIFLEIACKDTVVEYQDVLFWIEVEYYYELNIYKQRPTNFEKIHTRIAMVWILSNWYRTWFGSLRGLLGVAFYRAIGIFILQMVQALE
jgi:hypothetical protein